MRRALAVVSVLVCSPVACTPSEPPPSAPAPEAPSAEPERPSAKDRRPRTTLVGVLHEGGTQVCDQSAREYWIDRTWTVGFIPLKHPALLASALATNKGKVLVVTGLPGEGKPTKHEGDEPPAVTGECPIPQMRSDWELWPDGTRKRVGGSPEFDVFTVETVEVAEPIEAQAHEDEVWFAVTNPFAGPLVDATLVAHYEGCYGKPGTVTKRRPLGKISASPKLEDIPVPKVLGSAGPRGGEHRLDSVQLLGTVEGGALDLDVSLSSLGAFVACPGR